MHKFQIRHGTKTYIIGGGGIEFLSLKSGVAPMFLPNKFHLLLNRKREELPAFVEHSLEQRFFNAMIDYVKEPVI